MAFPAPTTNYFNNSINPLTGAQFGQRYWNLLYKRIQLPVFAKKDEFMQLLDQCQCVLIEAETGSGKTTQIPQWCAEWLRLRQPNRMGAVCCTQPRRLAATSVARRVAEEMDVKLGQEVGYTIRFEEQCSFQTVLKYCTDGILLAESTRNQLLEQYGIIVLDEVHERTLTTDVIMGLVKEIMKKRSELRVVVMSASLHDTGDFRKYFEDCPHRCLNIPGRSHPVQITYNDWDCTLENYLDKAIQKVVDIHTNFHKNEEGDILLFLTGQEEIEEACEQLKERIDVLKSSGLVDDLECLPLYSTLPPEEQQKIFAPRQCRRVGEKIIGRRCIVATNIAETSMTIDGIVFVVDSGYGKRRNYNPKTRVESLLVQKITRASAIQRAGRAGRTRPGKCYRLYTEHCYQKLMKQVDPEILHSNLANVVLRLMQAGIKNIYNFPLMNQPPRELLQQAMTLLNDLEAIDNAGQVTPLGSKLAHLPVDPPMARTLIASSSLRCSEDVIAICAMMSAPRCFNRPRKKQTEADAKKAQFIDDQGDHLTLLNVFNAYKRANCNAEWCFLNFLKDNSLQFAFEVCSQLTNIMQRLELTIYSRPDSILALSLHKFSILKSLVAGSFMKVAYFKSTGVGHLQNAKSGFYITAESVIFEQNGIVAAQHLLHGSSILFRPKVYTNRPEWVLYNEAIMQNNQKHYLQMVSVIRPEWLMELAPRYFRRMPATTELRKKLAEVNNNRTQLANNDALAAILGSMRI